MTLGVWIKAAHLTRKTRRTIQSDADDRHRTYGPAAIDMVQSRLDAARRQRDKRWLRDRLRALKADRRKPVVPHDGELFI
jgi:hypothetical protein